MSSTSASNFRMGKVVLGVAACILLNAVGLFAQDQGEQLFKGQITYCTCAGPDGHAATTDKSAATVRCAPPCTDAGANYVLFDAKKKVAYQLDNQELSKAFAAQDVFVIGTLKDAGTIHIVGIIRDLPPKVKQAKTVAVVCDACPRGMAKARSAAFQKLATWKRFTTVPDPKKADLIFLFSANPYRGNYLTRDGPDPRPVHIAITYMDVVDPQTGQSLWSDRERLGAWFVGDATRDLIDELRELLEADENPTERQLLLKRHRAFKMAPDVGK